MIVLETTKKISQTSTSPIGLSTSSASDENEPRLSFSQLLKGMSSKKDDTVIKNAALVLSLHTEETADAKEQKTTNISAKNETLLNLLKNNDTKSTTEPLVINPKATAELTTTEVKVLVGNAKKYLEIKILNSDEYKQSQIKELPKTLKGLVEVAKIIGLDVTKISVEEVQRKPLNDTLKQLEVKTQSTLNIPKETLKENPKSEGKAQLVDILNPKNRSLDDALKVQQPKAEKVVEDVKVQLQQAKSEKTTDEVKVQVQQPKAEKVVEDVAREVKTETKHLKTHLDVPITKGEKLTNETKTEIKTQINEQKVQTPKQEQIQELKQTQEVKQTPLFKAQTKTEHTTEQLVFTKVNSSIKIDERTPKERADETLKLLLRGEKPQQNLASSMTADFSVATAKVLRTPSNTIPKVVSQTTQTTQATQMTQTLEQMLRGDTSDAKSESATTTKTDTTTTGILKADSFEVKLNEAKQMVKYLSSDVKTAIEDYKSPFTRIKVQLNPQNLGEIDLTIVQRGKNLHVNLSSNNTAINTLAMNINDLKVQLSNNGINNASFNFSNNQDGGNSASSQQQQRHNEQQAQKEYNYFDNEETNEDILDSLEIVVPQYI